MLSTESTVLSKETSGATENGRIRNIVRDYTELLTLNNDCNIRSDRRDCVPIVSLTPVAASLVSPDILGSVDASLRQYVSITLTPSLMKITN